MDHDSSSQSQQKPSMTIETVFESISERESRVTNSDDIFCMHISVLYENCSFHVVPKYSLEH